MSKSVTKIILLIAISIGITSCKNDKISRVENINEINFVNVYTLRILKLVEGLDKEEVESLRRDEETGQFMYRPKFSIRDDKVLQKVFAEYKISSRDAQLEAVTCSMWNLVTKKGNVNLMDYNKALLEEFANHEVTEKTFDSTGIDVFGE